jgi:hypothetical protein
MVLASRAAACANPARPLSCADRALRTDGQRRRRGDIADNLTMMLAELTDGDPDFGYVIRLGVLTLLLIAAPFALYLLHQSGTTLGEPGRRSAALLVMALFVLGLPFAASGFFGHRSGGGLRPRDRRGAGDLADLRRVRLDRVVGVPLCLGSTGCARHIDEPRAPSADDYRRGLLHRRVVAVGRPDDSPKTLADNRIPCCCGDRIRDHHNSRRGARTAGRSRRAVGSRQAARGHTPGNPARPPAGAHTTVTGNRSTSSRSWWCHRRFRWCSSPPGYSRSSWHSASSRCPAMWPCCGPPKKPARSVNHHARERGSASTCRYPRPSCMCRCSWPCYPACTSP